MELTALVDGSGVQRRITEINQIPLTYLERAGEGSETLTIFLHGLGLDAFDYLPYLKRHNGLAVAVTLHGFEQDHKQDVEPVALERHAQLVSGLIDELKRKHSDKRMILVGFSLGADLILRLGEYWRDENAQTELAAAILLDPNVNHTTMTISSVFAQAHLGLGVAAKRLISDLPDTDDALIATICEYIGRIGVKDFRHIRRLSQDAVNYWDPAGYSQIKNRLATVAKFAQQVRVVLSGPYGCHLPHLTAEPGLGGQIKFQHHSEKDHFALIGSDFLAHQLSEVTN